MTLRVLRACAAFGILVACVVYALPPDRSFATGEAKRFAGCGDPVYVDDVVADGDNVWFGRNDFDSASENGLARLSLSTGECTLLNLGGGSADRLTQAGSDVWATVLASKTLIRVTSNGTVAWTSVLPGQPQDIVFDGTYLWVSLPQQHQVARIDPNAWWTQTFIDVGGFPGNLLVTPGSVWVERGAHYALRRIVPQTLQVLPVGNAQGGNRGLAWDGSTLWVGTHNTASAATNVDTVRQVNPVNGMTLFQTQMAVNHIAATGSFVYVNTRSLTPGTESKVVRINSTSHTFSTFAAQADSEHQIAFGLSVGLGYIWTTGYNLEKNALEVVRLTP